MIVLAAAAALVLTDARFSGTASARLETRARTANLSDSQLSQNANAASDVEVTPSLFGAIDNLGGRLALSYTPTLRMREWYAAEVAAPAEGEPRQPGGRRTELNHSQSFEARWTREGRPAPYLMENFYLGRVDLAAQQADPGTAGTPGAAAPGTPGSAANFQVGQVYQTSLDLNGGVAWPLSRVLVLDTSVGFNYSSGFGDNAAEAQTARDRIPTQQAYRSVARLDYQLTAVDLLISQLDGRHSRFPGEFSNFTLANASQRWRRQILASTSVELGVLLGAIHSTYLPRDMGGAVLDESQRVSGFTLAPGGDAVVRTRAGSAAHQVAVEGGVRVAPFIDRYIIAAFNRGELFAALSYAFRERWVLSGRGSVARSLTPVSIRGGPASDEVMTLGVEGRAGYQAPRYWRVEMYGLSSLYMIAGGSVNNWTVGLSLTLRAEGQT